jgi:HNH endonuclease
MAFDEATKLAAWNKGKLLETTIPKFTAKTNVTHGCSSQSTETEIPCTDGWEIDHITSQDHGGTDALSNLRPLQWKNNASKGAGRLKCVVTAKGEKNGPI